MNFSDNGYAAYPSLQRDMTRKLLVFNHISVDSGRPFCILEHIFSVYTDLHLQWQYELFCQPWPRIEEDQIFELLYRAASVRGRMLLVVLITTGL